MTERGRALIESVKDLIVRQHDMERSDKSGSKAIVN